ncbi:DUF1642 domain-containing protein [Lactococcus lactis]|uniref:DUF1642 domain-containing protein n=1 Tax=Lactococcus lactis TaxID=1358 RepID=UPI001F10FA9E|nr:DUF1642 domain-containing protein [Lactococcus lactis]UMU17987.1 DUF1642 domain-containing protein [Lactococcus lactis subsp. lactis]UMU18139.1 DUF1642 domain-containing protein [Lactococcus lactis subsp. lactis]
MARKDYIEKITQNLEHLTKDELKDVATLTNAQFGVRLKVAEKEYWEKEVEAIKSQLQQQALPVVPECVAEFIEDCKKEGDCLFGIFADATRVEHDMPDLVYFWLGDEGNNDELFARAWLDGYTVEKPQLFYIELPNVYGLKNKVSVSKVENGTIVEFSNGKNYALKLTEQEIKSIDERYWQFAVPVEDNK